jgi:hypothetical protein
MVESQHSSPKQTGASFTWLQEAGLKIKAVNSFFTRTNQIEYQAEKAITIESRINTTNQSTNNLQATKTIYWHGKLLP